MIIFVEADGGEGCNQDDTVDQKVRLADRYGHSLAAVTKTANGLVLAILRGLFLLERTL